MPRASYQGSDRRRSAASGRKSKKKRQLSRGPVLSETQRVMPLPGAPAPIVVKREETPVTQTISALPFIVKDLKRSAVIAGILLIILIVLSVTL